MSYPMYVFCAVIGALIYYFIEWSRKKEVHRLIAQREGCQPLRCLPNKWWLPFGLDKLQKVIQAERTKTYPQLMLREHETYGDTYAQWGGPIYTVITRDTRNIRAILSAQFRDFEIGGSRHGCVLPLLGSGIFTQDGPEWKKSRRLLAPIIQRPTLPELGLIERHFLLLQRSIDIDLRSDDPSVSSAINMKQRLLDLTLNMTTEFLIGEIANPAAAGSNATQWTYEFAAEFNNAFKWIAKRERLKNFYWMVDGLEFRNSCRAAQRLVDELVCRALEVRKMEKPFKAPPETFVALENLLQQGRDPEPIRDQFLNLLLAGRDSSGSLLCWMFYSLAREPQLVSDLTDEIESILGPDKSQKPDEKELNAMVKLDHFICETLRLFPPVPLNGRSSIQDTYLPHGGGENGEAPIFIPRGTLLAFSDFAAQRSRDLYGEDAGSFRIERWDDKSTKKRRMVDWSYFPFLAGPRKCLGERFAVTQAKYLACRMLQHYNQIIPTDAGGTPLTLESGGSWVDDVKYHVGLTMMPDAGVWLHLAPKI